MGYSGDLSVQPAHLTNEDTGGQRGEGTQTCLPLHPELWWLCRGWGSLSSVLPVFWFHLQLYFSLNLECGPLSTSYCTVFLGQVGRGQDQSPTQAEM